MHMNLSLSSLHTFIVLHSVKNNFIDDMFYPHSDINTIHAV